MQPDVGQFKCVTVVAVVCSVLCLCSFTPTGFVFVPTQFQAFNNPYISQSLSRTPTSCARGDDAALAHVTLVDVERPLKLR